MSEDGQRKLKLTVVAVEAAFIYDSQSKEKDSVNLLWDQIADTRWIPDTVTRNQHKFDLVRITPKGVLVYERRDALRDLN